MSIDDEWETFMLSADGSDSDSDADKNIEVENEKIHSGINNAPKATDIYISTKTNIIYLNKMIDIKAVFWKIPVMNYATPTIGVIKKQIKFNSATEEELNSIQELLLCENYYEQYIITNINNPTGRIKFKDIRKISIGVSNKDIMSYRCKKKSAFYNCFVLILRVKFNGVFKEIHVKVFNTGKMEIPGVQNDVLFREVLDIVLNILRPHQISEKAIDDVENSILDNSMLDNSILDYRPNSCETVLINSNFNCGYYINREALFDILRYKYNIQAIYDPCSYPGVQCKFYYNPDVGIQTGSQITQENVDKYINVKEVSFMIFRTGSVLIVGKCDEDVLRLIYEFLKVLLTNEYHNIGQKNTSLDTFTKDKDKKKKIRKKVITVTTAVVTA